MKSIIALALLVICAAQVQSGCLKTNFLYKTGGVHLPGYGPLGYYYGDGLGLYPHGGFAYGAHYPRSCSCGKCDTCKSVSYPYGYQHWSVV
uniref:Uncharacterized protein n=1 Tax=Anopheles epiroticus TaxID=199890 RepID=A0A182PRX2_9DIPT